MGSHRISVALCTYNGSRFLKEQLETIASQTVLPDELVISDDRSSDDTLAIALDFSKRSPFPVRIFVNSEQLGPGQNFGRAISVCEGDMIALADQDDIWKPEKLARLRQVLEERPDCAYVFSDAVIAHADGRPSKASLWEEVGIGEDWKDLSETDQLRLLLRHNLIPGSSMMFRASFKNVYLPIPSGWMHDYWIALLGCVFSSATAISDKVYLYRRHEGQVCGVNRKSSIDTILDSIRTPEGNMWRKLDMFKKLQTRVSSVNSIFQCDISRTKLIREKELHLEVRANIRGSKGLQRLMRVYHEMLTGRYRQYSNSWKSIIRDL